MFNEIKIFFQNKKMEDLFIKNLEPFILNNKLKKIDNNFLK